MSGPQPWRIRDRATFEALRRSGTRSRRGAISVTFTQIGEEQRARVAYAVGRKAGGAVARNRLRRRLRAVVAQLSQAGELAPGAYLVGAGAPASAQTYEELKREVAVAMTNACRAAR
ncbi:MAG: ribonuclease P protein component [Acidimicrobiales bacterium]